MNKMFTHCESGFRQATNMPPNFWTTVQCLQTSCAFLQSFHAPSAYKVVYFNALCDLRPARNHTGKVCGYSESDLVV